MNMFGLWDRQALPTDDSDLYFPAYNNEPSPVYSHQTQKQTILWPKKLQHGAAYWCSGLDLLICKGFGDTKEC